MSDGVESTSQSVDELLSQSTGRLGEVAQCLADGVTEPKEIVAAGAAANAGAVSVYLSTIRAIRGEEIPTAPSVARLALSSTRSFLKQHEGALKADDRERLHHLVLQLEDNATNRDAQEREEAVLQGEGESLDDVLQAEGGVYVYTFPHYWRFKTVDGSQRTLLKVGMTTKDAGIRVKQQARLTGMPEDPLLLRVYQHDSRDPRDVERDFHRLLDAADHTRSNSTAGGREWFETSVEFLDTVAAVLGLETREAQGTAVG